MNPNREGKGDRIPPASGEKVGGAVVSVIGREKQERKEEEEVVSFTYEVSAHYFGI